MTDIIICLFGVFYRSIVAVYIIEMLNHINAVGTHFAQQQKIVYLYIGEITNKTNTQQYIYVQMSRRVRLRYIISNRLQKPAGAHSFNRKMFWKSVRRFMADCINIMLDG